MFRHSTGLFAIVLSLILPGHAVAEIGSVAAVNRDMQGTPPTAEQRALTLGNRIYQDERIETSAVGSGQLMFLDQTTLTVAPESDIVLDEYVYNPETGKGAMALNMGRGMLRLVGGRITKSAEAIVRTPTASVGIRGGMVLIEVLADGSTRVVLIAGEYALVTDQDGRQLYLSRPNAEAEVGGSGLVFNGLLRSGDLVRYYERLEGAGNGGSSLGARTTVDVEDSAVAIAALNSEAPDGERRLPVSTSGESPVDPDDTQDEDVRNEERPDDQTFSSGSATPNTGGGEQTGGNNTPPLAVAPATGGVQFSGQNPATFTNIEFGSLIGTDVQGRTIRIPVAESAEDFIDLSSFPGADVFSFGNGRPDAGVVVFDESAGAVSSQFGALEGFGFSDLNENFHFYQFENIPADPTSQVEVTGFAVFGNPSPNQLRTFTTDTGTLDGETQNVTESFDVNNFVDFRGGNDSPSAILVKNAGIDRRDRGAGVRMIFAEERVEDAGNGLQNSEFGVYIGVDQGAAGVQFNNVFRGSENDTQSLLTTERTFNPVQTQAGATGSTVFGENDDYIVLAPVGGLAGNQQFVEGTFKRLGQAPETADFGGVLLERDAGAATVIDDPLPLAGQNLIRNNGLFDVGAISGLAVCSTGNCGRRDAAGNQEGVYELRGGYGDSVRMEFNSSGLDTNAFALVRLRMSDGEGSDLPGGSDFFEIRVTNPGESGYADDSRFAVSQGDTPQTLAGQQNSTDSTTLIMASSDLLGVAGEAQPEFARWGRWSMSMDIASQQREDIVHMGGWVAGIAPDASLLPSTLVASYEGIATATQFDFLSSQQSQLDGSFGLTYDFQDGEGLINFDLGAVAVNDIPVLGQFNNPAAYNANEFRGDTLVQVRGGFFRGGTDQVAATGGEFVINQESSADQSRIVGVFAGDRLTD